MSREHVLIASLRDSGINYELHEHEPVFTVEESASLHARTSGAHTKNLFLKDGSGRYWLVVLPASARADLKRLAPLINSRKLSFGNPDELSNLLGVTPGAVTPLGVINDAHSRVTVIIDEQLMSAPRLNVHPLRNTATIGLRPQDLSRFLMSLGHTPVLLRVPTAACQEIG